MQQNISPNKVPMKKKIIFVICCFIISLIFIGNASATKYPNIHFKVQGQVFDWDSKKPLPNAHILIFLNGSPYADNNGWVKHEKRSKTDEAGVYETISILFRGLHPSINKIELLVFKRGYRTERFLFESISTDKLPTVDIPKKNIELPSVYLLKLRHK